MTKKFKTQQGCPLPLGVSKQSNGFNFALFSQHATAVSLCLFDPHADKVPPHTHTETVPIVEIPLDPSLHKTGNVWHIFIVHLPGNYYYGYRIEGPYEPIKGHCFNKELILLDPYAYHVMSPHQWGTSRAYEQSFIQCGMVYPFQPFDWGEDAPPHIPMHELVIYEMHVRGFTYDPSSAVSNKGLFEGICEKIPYLRSLGINAVELMPIHEFNEIENPNRNPLTGEVLYNYWGYSTLNFFALMNRYGTIESFKTLVKELHANGIEVILDVVYNHTAEGNEAGPTLSFKGIENSVYYMLSPHGEYYNFSGCGNTLNCNHPIVSELIRSSLRYFVTEMHVDGFRFDLASILVRSHEGIPLANPPLIDLITQDPVLAQTKLIAEAWDAGGLYQVGSFPGKGRWAEWNGKYRDSVRRFLKGTDGEAGTFATRLSGSEDLYKKGQLSTQSINFITAHDGFTLADLVSYNQKHNESNGEFNRDGINHNESWNCGVEGPSNNPKIVELRERQIKNHALALLISQGVPMLLMGDEYGHSKLGNNNTWGHDSRLNWFQWDTLEKNQALFRFFRHLIAFRKRHPVVTRSHFLREYDVTWHGIEPGKPDWSGTSRFVACTLPDTTHGYSLYIAFNAYYHEITVHLPWRDTPWHTMIYTAHPSPKDIVEEENAPIHPSPTFTFAAHSALVLKAYEEPQRV